MAPIPATLTINFISNYAGPHRVCWRINGTGPYDCTTIINCVGGGGACAANVVISVDQSTCPNVSFDGYVQAACELEASLNGRVYWTPVIFVPDQPCKKYDVTCSAVDIPSYNVLIPGDGYIVGSNPPLTIIGGGGSGAAAHGIVGNGGVKTWTITNGGAGYNGGGSATFVSVPAVNLVGAGVGATFDVIVTAGVITAIILTPGLDTAPGIGYVATDTFEFNNALLGGSGAGVIVTVDSVNTGEIQYIQVTSPGSAYSSLPAVTVQLSPGITTAIASANLGECPAFDFEDDCAGNPQGVVGAQPLGYVYKKCSAIAPTPPADWVVTINGCCYDCLTAQFTNNTIGGSADIKYTDCATGAILTINVVFGVPQAVCAVNNSWFWDPSQNISVATSPGCP